MARFERDGWGTRVGLVLAMAGNAVGLGNFLRFPAQAAQNGGGAFLIPYLISFLVMGIPLLWVEWTLGRYGGRFGKHSIPGIFDALSYGPRGDRGEAAGAAPARRSAWRRALKYVGVLGLFIPLGVAAFYCYIESWALAYAVHSVIGTFREIPATEFFPTYLGQVEGSLTAVPVQAMGFFVVTLILNTVILSRGVARGIEATAKIAMPLLLICGAVLAIRGLTLSTGDPGVVASPLDGLGFIWNPDLSGLGDPTVWLAAAGQVFFTLSVGMGAVACYASYVGRDQDIALNSTAAGWMNEFVEIVLGASIMIPIATAYLGLGAVQEATAGGNGFGIGFLTLPTLFTNWGTLWGSLAGLLWFGLLFFAGITSSLAMGQPLLAFFEDELGFSRVRAAVTFGVMVLLLGGFCVWLMPGGALDEFDFWAGTFLLVVFGLIEVLVFVVVLGAERGWRELNRGGDLSIPRLFVPIFRWVTPLFIGLIFLAALIKPAGGDWTGSIRGFAAGQGWELAADSVVGKVLHVEVPEAAWFDDAGRATPVLVQDGARLLMALVFLAGCLLVLWVWRNRPEEAPVEVGAAGALPEARGDPGPGPGSGVDRSAARGEGPGGRP